MAKYTTYYCCMSNGKSQVKGFVDLLDIATYRKFVFKKKLLEEFGPKLPMPHARHVGRGLYELRLAGTDGAIRVFYFFEERVSIVFLHAFIKKTNRTPQKELAIALKRMKAYLK